jgi:hypothetical protein
VLTIRPSGEEKQFDALDDDTLDILEAELEKNNAKSSDANDPVHALRIFDDVQVSLREHEKRLHVLSSYRHRNLSCWILMLRRWRLRRKSEMCDFLWQGVLPLLRCIYRDRHDFTWVDREKNTLTRNMDYLCVEDGDVD